jgi:hypothetical protein
MSRTAATRSQSVSSIFTAAQGIFFVILPSARTVVIGPKR